MAVTVSSVQSVAASSYNILSVNAPSGERVIGGGFSEVASDGSDLTSASGPQFVGSRPKADGSGWEVIVNNGAASTAYVKLWVTSI